MSLAEKEMDMKTQTATKLAQAVRNVIVAEGYDDFESYDVLIEFDGHRIEKEGGFLSWTVQTTPRALMVVN